MLPILNFSTTDSVRAVLGISEKDMSDLQLTDRNLELELRLDLSSWVSNAASLAEAVNAGTATQAELDILDSVGLYATYFCAKLVIPSLQMGAAHSISDGKNSMDRFASINWDQLYDRITERAAFYKKLVLNLNTPTTAAAYKPFSLVASSYDPVTGT